MNGEASSSPWAVYLEAIREHAHQLLAWGYADVRHRLHSEMDEPSITGIVCQAMQRRIDAPETPELFMHNTIGDQTPVSPAGELGNDRLRLDINVRKTGIRPQLVYVFEGKRLRTGGFPIGKYTGEGGMGDFLSGRYAADCPEGAMVGFWQDKNADHWIAQLGKTFERDQEDASPRFSIKEGLTRHPVIDSIPHEMRSTHVRADGSELALLHIFLEACSPRFPGVTA